MKPKSSEDIIATWKSRKKATKQQTIAIIMFNYAYIKVARKKGEYFSCR